MPSPSPSPPCRSPSVILERIYFGSDAAYSVVVLTHSPNVLSRAQLRARPLGAHNLLADSAA